MKEPYLKSEVDVYFEEKLYFWGNLNSFASFKFGVSGVFHPSKME